MKLALITGGAPHYETGLVAGLLEQNLELDILGGDELSGNKIFEHPSITFHNVQKGASNGRLGARILRVLGVYGRIMKYAWKTPVKIFHLQWPYKIVLFDRTLLALYYKALGKRIVFTAHNIDGFAHGKSSLCNHLSLKFFYALTDHLIVHTEKMRGELERVYGVARRKVTVIPHGIMDAVPETAMTRNEARQSLGIEPRSKVVLSFGLITPYKGLELLVGALSRLKKQGETFTAIIAGRIKECQPYWEGVQREIRTSGLEESIVLRLGHVPDEEVEIYFKAADLLVLPYRNIDQSGVLFLAYHFGLPVVATDVGSLREDIVEGKTGFVSAADDSKDLARTIQRYFSSGLYAALGESRKTIRNYAQEKYSWNSIGKRTEAVYQQVLARNPIERTPSASAVR